ncbi:hypothetical protein NMG60_11018256 [Bertholletia excelsa]
MEPNQYPSNPRKVKFPPKAPPRRAPKPAVPKTEDVADDGYGPADGVEAAESFHRRLSERLMKRGPKVEKKSPVQVAFSHESASSTSIRTYGPPREGSSGKGTGSGQKTSAAGDDKIPYAMASVVESGTKSETDVNAEYTLSKKKKKPYVEQWVRNVLFLSLSLSLTCAHTHIYAVSICMHDITMQDYEHTYYPTTLPWRRSYSGDPEQLDEEEFGNAAVNSEYDENTTNDAFELGLLEAKNEQQMLFFQFPPDLPAVNQSKRCYNLEELPAGHTGKMLVYKNGAVKLKLGDIIYDVSPGVSIMCPQQVAAVNAVDRRCCMLGELEKRAVVTPNVDSLLNSVPSLK